MDGPTSPLCTSRFAWARLVAAPVRVLGPVPVRSSASVSRTGRRTGPRRSPRPHRRAGGSARVARSSLNPRDRDPGRRPRRSPDDLANPAGAGRDGTGAGPGPTTTPGPTPGWHGPDPGRPRPGPACAIPCLPDEIPELGPVRGRVRLAQCEPSATQSTPAHAMRAQRDEIRLRSILVSPPGAMRARVTSPERHPRGRGRAGRRSRSHGRSHTTPPRWGRAGRWCRRRRRSHRSRRRVARDAAPARPLGGGRPATRRPARPPLEEP